MAQWIKSFVAGIASTVIATTCALAADNSGTILGGVGLFGALLGVAQKEAAKKEWDALQPAELKQCIDIGLRWDQTNIDGLINAGIKPNDQRLTGLRGRCNILTGTVPRKNFACTVKVDGKRSLPSTCSEVYVAENQIVSFEDYIVSDFRGQNVRIVAIENADAKSQRIAKMAAEKKAAEERQMEAARRKAEEERVAKETAAREAAEQEEAHRQEVAAQEAERERIESERRKVEEQLAAERAQREKEERELHKKQLAEEQHKEQLRREAEERKQAEADRIFRQNCKSTIPAASLFQRLTTSDPISKFDDLNADREVYLKAISFALATDKARGAYIARLSILLADVKAPIKEAYENFLAASKDIKADADALTDRYSTADEILAAAAEWNKSGCLFDALDQIKAVHAEFASDLIQIAALKEEASETGFSAMVEMQSAAKLGFSTKAEFEIAGKYRIKTGDELRTALAGRTLAAFVQSKEKEERDAQAKKEQEERDARAKEEAELMNDGERLYRRYVSSAAGSCMRAIERRATYSFQWIEPDGWLLRLAETDKNKFPSFLPKAIAPGVLTIAGEKIKMQNGFGAWRIMHYQCDYDVKKDIVVDVRVAPR